MGVKGGRAPEHLTPPSIEMKLDSSARLGRPRRRNHRGVLVGLGWSPAE